MDVVEPSQYRGMSRPQRDLLGGCGVVYRRRPSASNRAQVNLQRLMDEANGHVLILWADNYNIYRFATNPNVPRDQSINGTVFAALPTQIVLPGGTWLPTLRDLVGRLHTTSSWLHHCAGTLSDDIRDTVARDYTWSQLRVPADVRRYGVTSLAWYPYCVASGNIGSAVGLGEAFQTIQSLKTVYPASVPLLLDVNPYYRLLKAAYCITNERLNITAALQDHPLLFGAWHAYAHCVKKTFRDFLFLWAPLDNPSLLVASPAALLTRVYAHPKLATLEHMVVALYLVAPRVRRRVTDLTAHIVQVTAANDKWRRICGCLELFLFEYIPALLTIGIRLRECYWQHRAANTGGRARDVLGYCLVYLGGMHRSLKSEYLRGLSLAQLLWNPAVHSVLPAAAYVEECLEASISRLHAAAGEDLSASNVDRLSLLYRAMGPPRRSVKDADHPGISQVYPFRVQLRLERVLQAITQRVLPRTYIAQTAAKFAIVTHRWPDEEPRVPCRLLIRELDQADYLSLLQQSLKTTLDAKAEDDSGALHTICSLFPPRDAATRSQRREALINLGDYLVRQLGNRRGQPRRRVPRDSVATRQRRISTGILDEEQPDDLEWVTATPPPSDLVIETRTHAEPHTPTDTAPTQSTGTTPPPPTPSTMSSGLSDASDDSREPDDTGSSAETRQDDDWETSSLTTASSGASSSSTSSSAE